MLPVHGRLQLLFSLQASRVAVLAVSLRQRQDRSVLDLVEEKVVVQLLPENAQGDALKAPVESWA
jgi:hypothetical protein